MNTPRFYGHSPLNLANSEMPGHLIVIEGTDGVGRSTQIALLKEWLETEGYAVMDTGFRRSDLTGSGIDRAMRGHTLDLFTLNLFYATDFWDRMEKAIVPLTWTTCCRACSRTGSWTTGSLARTSCGRRTDTPASSNTRARC